MILGPLQTLQARIPVSEIRPQMFTGPDPSPAEELLGSDVRHRRSITMTITQAWLLTLILRLAMTRFSTMILMFQICSDLPFLRLHLTPHHRFRLFMRRLQVLHHRRLRLFLRRSPMFHLHRHLLGVFFLPMTLVPVREVALHPLTMAG